MLVAAVNLLDIVDAAGALGTEGGNKQCHTGAYVGRGHAYATQLVFVVETNHRGTVRVAENDLRTHVDEFVDKEQAALKHLLVYQHAALGLRGYHKGNGYEVGREAWPRRVGDGEDAKRKNLPNAMPESGTTMRSNFSC